MQFAPLHFMSDRTSRAERPAPVRAPLTARGGSIVVALLLAACTQSGATVVPEQWRALQITATPIALGVEQIGRLRFRGGLVLTSEDGEFGGLSGFEVLDGNRLLIHFKIALQPCVIAFKIGLGAERQILRHARKLLMPAGIGREIDRALPETVALDCRVQRAA